MPRTLSPEAAASALAQRTAEVWLDFARISGPGLSTFRIVNNTEAITRGDGVYLPYPFEAELPEDAQGAAVKATIRIDNIDRAVARLLRSYVNIATITLWTALASQPDTIERGPFELAIVGADGDEMSLHLALGSEEDALNQRVPSQIYTPSNSAGLFL